MTNLLTVTPTHANLPIHAQRSKKLDMSVQILKDGSWYHASMASIIRQCRDGVTTIKDGDQIVATLHLQKSHIELSCKDNICLLLTYDESDHLATKNLKSIAISGGRKVAMRARDALSLDQLKIKTKQSFLYGCMQVKHVNIEAKEMLVLSPSQRLGSIAFDSGRLSTSKLTNKLCVAANKCEVSVENFENYGQWSAYKNTIDIGRCHNEGEIDLSYCNDVMCKSLNQSEHALFKVSATDCKFNSVISNGTFVSENCTLDFGDNAEFNRFFARMTDLDFSRSTRIDHLRANELKIKGEGLLILGCYNNKDNYKQLLCSSTVQVKGLIIKSPIRIINTEYSGEQLTVYSDVESGGSTYNVDIFKHENAKWDSTRDTVCAKKLNYFGHGGDGDTSHMRFEMSKLEVDHCVIGYGHFDYHNSSFPMVVKEAFTQVGGQLSLKASNLQIKKATFAEGNSVLLRDESALICHSGHKLGHFDKGEDCKVQIFYCTQHVGSKDVGRGLDLSRKFYQSHDSEIETGFFKVEKSFTQTGGSKLNANKVVIEGTSAKIGGSITVSELFCATVRDYHQSGTVKCPTKFTEEELKKQLKGIHIDALNINCTSSAHTEGDFINRVAHWKLSDSGSLIGGKCSDIAPILVGTGTTRRCRDYESYSILSWQTDCLDVIKASRKSSVIDVNFLNKNIAQIMDWEAYNTKSSVEKILIAGTSIVLPTMMGAVGLGVAGVKIFSKAYPVLCDKRSWSDLGTADYLPIMVESINGTVNACQFVFSAFSKDWSIPCFNDVCQGAKKLPTWQNTKQFAIGTAGILSGQTESSLISVGAGNVNFGITKAGLYGAKVSADFDFNLNKSNTSLFDGQVTGLDWAYQNNLNTYHRTDGVSASWSGFGGGSFMAYQYDQSGSFNLASGMINVGDWNRAKTSSASFDSCGLKLKNYNNEGQSYWRNTVGSAETFNDTGELHTQGLSGVYGQNVSQTGKLIMSHNNGDKSTFVLHGTKSLHADGYGDIGDNTLILSGHVDNAAGHATGHNSGYSCIGGHIIINHDRKLTLDMPNLRSCDVTAVGKSVKLPNGWNGNGYDFIMKSTKGDVVYNGKITNCKDFAIFSARDVIGPDGIVKVDGSSKIVAMRYVNLVGGCVRAGTQSLIAGKKGVTLSNGTTADGIPIQFVHQAGEDLVDADGNVIANATTVYSSEGEVHRYGVLTSSQGTNYVQGTNTQTDSVVVDKVVADWYTCGLFRQCRVDTTKTVHHVAECQSIGKKNIMVASKGKNRGNGASFLGQQNVFVSQHGNEFHELIYTTNYTEKVNGVFGTSKLYKSDDHVLGTLNLSQHMVAYVGDTGDNIFGGTVIAKVLDAEQKDGDFIFEKTYLNHKCNQKETGFFVSGSPPPMSEPLVDKFNAMSEASGDWEKICAGTNFLTSFVNSSTAAAQTINDGSYVQSAFSRYGMTNVEVGYMSSTYDQAWTGTDDAVINIDTLNVKGNKLIFNNGASGKIGVGNLDIDQIVLNAAVGTHSSGYRQDSISLTGNPLGVVGGISHYAQSLSGVAYNNALLDVGHLNMMRDGATIILNGANMSVQTMNGRNIGVEVTSCQDYGSGWDESFHMDNQGGVGVSGNSFDYQQTNQTSSFILSGKPLESRGPSQENSVSFSYIKNTGADVKLPQTDSQSVSVDRLETYDLVDTINRSGGSASMSVPATAESLGAEPIGSSSTGSGQAPITTIPVSKSSEKKVDLVHALYNGPTPHESVGDPCVALKEAQRENVIHEKSNIKFDIPLTDKERLTAAGNEIATAKNKIEFEISAYFWRMKNSDHPLLKMVQDIEAGRFDAVTEEEVNVLLEDLPPEKLTLLESIAASVGDTAMYGFSRLFIAPISVAADDFMYPLLAKIGLAGLATRFQKNVSYGGAIMIGAVTVVTGVLLSEMIAAGAGLIGISEVALTWYARARATQLVSNIVDKYWYDHLKDGSTYMKDSGVIFTGDLSTVLEGVADINRSVNPYINLSKNFQNFIGAGSLTDENFSEDEQKALNNIFKDISGPPQQGDSSEKTDAPKGASSLQANSMFANSAPQSQPSDHSTAEPNHENSGTKQGKFAMSPTN